MKTLLLTLALISTPLFASADICLSIPASMDETLSELSEKNEVSSSALRLVNSYREGQILSCDEYKKVESFYNYQQKLSLETTSAYQTIKNEGCREAQDYQNVMTELASSIKETQQDLIHLDQLQKNLNCQ